MGDQDILTFSLEKDGKNYYKKCLNNYNGLVEFFMNLNHQTLQFFKSSNQIQYLTTDEENPKWKDISGETEYNHFKQLDQKKIRIIPKEEGLGLIIEQIGKKVINRRLFGLFQELERKTKQRREEVYLSLSKSLNQNKIEQKLKTISVKTVQSMSSLNFRNSFMNRKSLYNGDWNWLNDITKSFFTNRKEISLSNFPNTTISRIIENPPEQKPEKEEIHDGIQCNQCNKENIKGCRYVCAICKKDEKMYNLCKSCKNKLIKAKENFHDHHFFIKVIKDDVFDKELETKEPKKPKKPQPKEPENPPNVNENNYIFKMKKIIKFRYNKAKPEKLEKLFDYETNIENFKKIRPKHVTDKETTLDTVAFKHVGKQMKFRIDDPEKYDVGKYIKHYSMEYDGKPLNFEVKIILEVHDIKN